MLRKQFAARVWAKLKGFERSQALFRHGDRVLAAVSGGPDSVCLAHFLSVEARTKGFSLMLAHVHHGLRGRAADKDAQSVRKLGKKLGLEAFFSKVDVPACAASRGRGMEEAARHLRYRALSRIAAGHGCGKVATGHQLDDQAETVLPALAARHEVVGLAGIPARRPLTRRIELVRPPPDHPQGGQPLPQAARLERGSTGRTWTRTTRATGSVARSCPFWRSATPGSASGWQASRFRCAGSGPIVCYHWTG